MPPTAAPFAERLWALLVTAAVLASSAGAGAQQPTPPPETGATSAARAIRDALQNGHGELAVELAQQRLQSAPGDAQALTLLGLARFRIGRLEQALSAFERALAAPDVAQRSSLEFNRASTLYRLGRFDLAEEGFSAAAGSSKGELRLLATINAGFAALDANRIAVAARYAERARRLPHAAGAAELMAELEAEIAREAQDPVLYEVEAARQAEKRGKLDAAEHGYKRALRLAQSSDQQRTTQAELHYLLGSLYYDQARFAQAQHSFEQARQLAPDDAELALMSGLAAQQNHDDLAAERWLRRGLDLGLEGFDRDIARASLEAVAPGPGASGSGLGVLATSHAGYDSNVAQLNANLATNCTDAGCTDPAPILGSTGGSGLIRVGAEIGYGLAPSVWSFARLSYAFEQTLYTSARFDYFNLQQHSLRLDADTRLDDRARLRAGGHADWLHSGPQSWQVRELFPWSTPLLHDLGGYIGVGLDLGRGLRSGIEATLSRSTALSDLYPYLGGTRFDLAWTNQLQRGSLLIGAHLGVRSERIGALVATATSSDGSDLTYHIPLGYSAPWLDLRAALPIRSLAWLAVETTLEHRRYDSGGSRSSVSYDLLGSATSNTALALPDRRDTVLGLGLSLRVPLGRAATLALQYNGSRSISNVNGTGGADYANFNFFKHVLGSELSLQW